MRETKICVKYQLHYLSESYFLHLACEKNILKSYVVQRESSRVASFLCQERKRERERENERKREKEREREAIAQLQNELAFTQTDNGLSKTAPGNILISISANLDKRATNYGCSITPYLLDWGCRLLFWSRYYNLVL
jgi:hypothetical protein